MIEFESVSKTYRDGTTAVDNLSLVVPSGRITVIVGPSGCGKTTTLRMINRMLEPSKGKISWDGKPIKSRRKTALRRQMGYVIQSGGLFPHRTVLENIATVPDLLRWDKDKSRKRAAELLGSVGLDRKLGQRYPSQLSGGQQQRVGVARALAADPLVLLMDEPFSAVDPVVRSELHDFFLGLQHQLSKTIILITHDIDEAIKLGDQVAILRVGGRLAQVGTPQQLLDQPADAFVEGFVGKDRGYRSLSFQPASGLTLGGVQVARDAGHVDAQGPVLVVDADARPVGWADPSRPGGVIALGATFDPETDSLRAALDAALTSPTGLAVAATGASRRYAGVVDVEIILRQVTRTRAEVAGTITVQGYEQPESPYGPPWADVAPAGVPAPYDDPDATSIREVPPVEDDAWADAAGAAGTTEVVPGSVEDDPDATRVSGPLSEDLGPEDPGPEELPQGVPSDDAQSDERQPNEAQSDDLGSGVPEPGEPGPAEPLAEESQIGEFRAGETRAEVLDQDIEADGFDAASSERESIAAVAAADDLPTPGEPLSVDQPPTAEHSFQEQSFQDEAVTDQQPAAEVPSSPADPGDPDRESPR